MRTRVVTQKQIEEIQRMKPSSIKQGRHWTYDV